MFKYGCRRGTDDSQSSLSRTVLRTQTTTATMFLFDALIIKLCTVTSAHNAMTALNNIARMTLLRWRVYQRDQSHMLVGVCL